MAKQTTFEQLALASIDNLKKRKLEIESVLNDKPFADLVAFQEKVKREFADYLNEDGTLNYRFWESKNREKLEKLLSEFAKEESAIYKRIDLQIKLNSSDAIDEIVKIDSELSDLHTELYYINQKKSKL